MSRSVSMRRAAVAGAVVVVMAGGVACSASAADDTEPESRSFALKGSTLTVDSDDADLEIIASDDQAAGSVGVTRWFQGSVVVGKEPEVTWSMDDDRLTLRLQCSGFVADCAARHRIEVPRGIAVEVQDDDGNVRAEGFDEPLGIRTTDGTVRVSGTSGALDIRTTDGSVHVTDSTGPMKLRTDDGDIRAEADSREVTTHSGDGSVSLELGVVPDRVESRAGDGNVTITLPRAGYRVSTETGDGGVDVSVPRDDSSDHVVTARTGDGKVTLRTAN
ncbi:DUF4097 family beta strand repeat-containing protein [Streptomyces sp. NPDC056716]|uniref:DUF4097 family beta strand repeat-containing protein n=1 Tax=unclassified Streptomyces TaxID=2593676 RepID=UPI00369B754D